ncbi:thiol-disulfide oxidoreductase DCC family protein [Spirosoma sp. KNUC1025]|uniref:thiol-disulfide oxidoreductase DCC family protein n=1 Tax=Spirosoma sp. KNUC1025 TaxID=2894082 RepID=UPI00386CB187|nr:DCC1-like thiol-disulfide oxidoreductase family protein [Spirosoma sp. KNUC1025]
MKATIIFDGICGFCNVYVQFVIRRDPDAYFGFVSAQSDSGMKLLRANGIRSFDSIVLIESGNVLTKSNAILHICRHLTGLWSWLEYFRYVPRPLRDLVYDSVARHRYRLGKKTVCQLPTPAERQRMILS